LFHRWDLLAATGTTAAAVVTRCWLGVIMPLQWFTLALFVKEELAMVTGRFECK
jgi:hypothetical protein